MAANTTPIFPLTPRIGIAALTNGVATRANGAALGTAVLAAGANGTRIEEIRVKSETTLAASSVLIFIDNGTTSFLIDEFVVTVIVGSTTVASYAESRGYRNLILPAGFTLRANITVTPTTGACIVYALGGDY
jgi:hypothetical protein